MSTNIGRKFLSLVDRCFPTTHPLNKIFNRRTVKISYSTMPSLGRIIEGHNSKVLRGEVAEVPKRPWGNCSCPRRTREAGECPLGGECLAENIVYRASVEVKADEEVPPPADAGAEGKEAGAEADATPAATFAPPVRPCWPRCFCLQSRACWPSSWQ